MKLTEDFIERVINESISEIAVRSSISPNTYRNKRYEAYKESLCNLDTLVWIELVELIFMHQSICISEKTAAKYDRISIPKLGYLRRSHMREKILAAYDNRGDNEFTKEDVKRIIKEHFERLEFLKTAKDYKYNINIQTNAEIDREINAEGQDDLF